MAGQAAASAASAALTEFFEKWTEVLYTEATVKPSGCLEIMKRAQDKDGYPVYRLTMPGVGRKVIVAARLMLISWNDGGLGLIFYSQCLR
jgi:hypothetical protein